MKKVMMIALAITLFAMPAFATKSWTDGGEAISATDGSALSVLSNNVQAEIVSSADRFAAATFHTTGSKAFASSSESTKIFSNTATSLPGLTNSDTADFGGWTPL